MNDAVTVRAVRMESRLVAGLQALLKPGGLLLFFRGPTGAYASETISPLLAWRATYPLVESLGSRLVVLEKRQVWTTQVFVDQA